MPSAAPTGAVPTNKPTTIPATAMPLISPTALLRAHLQQNPPIRPSTRIPEQPQQIHLNTGSLTHTNGSSVVKIGATTIVCGIRAEVLPVTEIPSYDPRAESLPNDPSHISPEQHTPISLYNLLVPNLELSTGCSPFHPANSPPSSQAQSLSQRLYTLLLTSNIIHSSDLAITYRPPPEVDAELDPDDPAYVSREPETKAFWVLYIDMVCISYGGEASVFDAAWLSLQAALWDTKLPDAQWNADEKIVLCDPEISKGRILQVRTCPVPLGFGVVNNDDNNQKDAKGWVLIDPDAFEEQCCDEMGCVTVDLSPNKEKAKIVRIEKSGGGRVGVAELKEILGCAEKRWKEWQSVLDRTIELKTG